MKLTLAAIALVSVTFSSTVFAQTAEPEIQVIGAGASSGGAQDSIGSGAGKRAKPAILNVDPAMPKDDLVRSFLVDYARCLYDLDRRGVERLSALVPGTNDYAQLAKRVAVNQCISTGDMKFRHSSLQGALFLYRYKAEFGSRTPILKADPIDYAALAGGTDEWSRRFVAYRKFAQCVVRTDPVASRALVLGPVGSANEAAAIQTLSPALGSCIDKGVTINLTKERLSGLVAEALYRLSTRDGAN